MRCIGGVCSTTLAACSIFQRARAVSCPRIADALAQFAALFAGALDVETS
jgi:hypothetical protein